MIASRQVNIFDYVSQLSGDKLKNILLKSEKTLVIAKMSSFSGKFNMKMKGSLKSMGINEIFSERADFSRLGKWRKRNSMKKYFYG